MGFNFSFFGTQEHREFNYKPRYYDVEKAKREEMFGHVDGTKEKNYTPGSYIQGSLRDRNYRKSKPQGRSQAIIGAVSLILFFVVMVFIVKFYNLLWTVL